MKANIKNKKIKYSTIKRKLFLEKFDKNINHLAKITHHLQKKNDVNFHSVAFKKILNGYAKSVLCEPIFQYKMDVDWDVPFPPPSNPKFTFIDLFAGIGGFRIAMQSLGGKCVFSSEIDLQARKSYETNFGEVPYGDIREFTNENISDEDLDKLIPDHQILCAGFPCQPFSLAGISARNFLGKVHGFMDINQGNLFFDILRIVSIKKPKILFLENVKNLKSHDEGKTFKTIQELIEAQGYIFKNKIISSQTLVPQKRERTYMVAYLVKNKNFQFPEFSGDPIPLKSILENNVDAKYTISDRLWAGHQNRSKRNKERGTGFTTKVADINKPANTIVARYYKDGKECLVPQLNKNPRKLTPRECARVQGFPEKYILPISDVSGYRQFGNSVSVPVIKKIGKEIIKLLGI